jgi:8-oxo-dGTP pyrophosphatase MutT (NUDIX family)
MNIVERDSRSSEDGRTHRFYLLQSRDWCNIIPVTEDGKVVLVRQHRIGIDEQSLEIPGGIVDPEDADVQAGAIREMIEETGYVPVPGAKCRALGSSHPNPAILNNRVHSFVIGPVRREKDQKLDEGEMIECVEVPIAEIPEMIRRGDISHALMLNTFFFLALEDEKIRIGLARCLESFQK